MSTGFSLRVNGVRILYNAEKEINERLIVRISKLTALFFVDGKHEVSLYPSGLENDVLKSILDGYLDDYGIYLSSEEISMIVAFIKEHIV